MRQRRMTRWTDIFFCLSPLFIGFTFCSFSFPFLFQRNVSLIFGPLFRFFLLFFSFGTQTLTCSYNSFRTFIYGSIYSSYTMFLYLCDQRFEKKKEFSTNSCFFQFLCFFSSFFFVCVVFSSLFFCFSFSFFFSIFLVHFRFSALFIILIFFFCFLIFL